MKTCQFLNVKWVYLVSGLMTLIKILCLEVHNVLSLLRAERRKKLFWYEICFFTFVHTQTYTYTHAHMQSNSFNLGWYIALFVTLKHAPSFLAQGLFSSQNLQEIIYFISKYSLWLKDLLHWTHSRLQNSVLTYMKI